MRIDPPPSPPVASDTSPPDTAAAEPPDDPPTVRPRCHGLCVTPFSFVTLTFKPAELARRGLADRDRTAAVDEPLDDGRGVVRDPVLEHERRLGERPALDRLELLDAGRHAAERLREVRVLRGVAGPGRCRPSRSSSGRSPRSRRATRRAPRRASAPRLAVRRRGRRRPRSTVRRSCPHPRIRPPRPSHSVAVHDDASLADARVRAAAGRAAARRGRRPRTGARESCACGCRRSRSTSTTSSASTAGT